MARTRHNSLDASAGSLGGGWTHNHSAALTAQPDGDVTFRAEDGKHVEYALQCDDSFQAAAGALSTLVSIAGGYKLTRSDQLGEVQV